MHLSTKLDRLHAKAKGNKWLRYFAVFNRIALAAGFLPAGLVKIMGERFTSLSVNHPMGHYLEALHLTGYYYPFIGVLQVAAAIMLLIPRTALLGALIYFPIIINICILSLAVRFDGSLITSPLMVLANLYLLCWDYDKLKFILPFRHPAPPKPEFNSNKFPVQFFAGVVATIAIVVLGVSRGYDIMPRNTLAECKVQCTEGKNPKACTIFCEGIHQNGRPLDKSLDDYHQALIGKALKK
jgi:uncharacterized membrane protein YphA (DoxX/SURF4 family)